MSTFNNGTGLSIQDLEDLKQIMQRRGIGCVELISTQIVDGRVEQAILRAVPPTRLEPVEISGRMQPGLTKFLQPV